MCPATDSNSGPVYYFYTITGNSFTITDSNINDAILEFTNVQISDGGNYTILRSA